VKYPTFLIILLIICMQGIYNYIPETNLVSRVYNVAAVLYLQFVIQVMLLRSRNIFRTFTLALAVVTVHCPIWLFFFCRFLISCSLDILLKYCLSDFEMFQSPLLIPVSLLLSCSTCAELLLYGLDILKSS